MTINLNLSKNLLKLAMLAAITYLILNITSNFNISNVRFQDVDTSRVNAYQALK